MKAIQALGWYYPDSAGGTESYVSALVRELAPLGVSSVVAAPAQHRSDSSHEGTPVHRYAIEPQRSLAQLSGAAPHGGFAAFEQWLQGQEATVYHQHSWTYGCGLHHLLAARRRGLRTLLTVHVPGPACPRGTMLHGGATPCAGMTQDRRCSACWLQWRGASAAAQAMLAWVPPSVGAMARPLGRAGTALAARAHVQAHRASLLRAADAAERVIAVCEWLHQALRVAGVPHEKLVLCRQGVPHQGDAREARGRREPGGRLRVGFLGRWDPLKGPGLLVEAVLRLAPELPVEVVLHGLEPADAAGEALRAAVRGRAAQRPQSVTIAPPLAPGETARFLQSIDLLAVPSQWMETGPLVVLEAFAVGTPVIGSALGGIAELVRDGVDGRLLPHDDVQAWACTLAELAQNPLTVQSWRRNIRPVRSMRQVAEEMLALYRGLA